MTDNVKSLDLDPDLQARLAALAAKTGQSADTLALQILNTHIEELDRLADERDEDEARWQRYVETGQTVSYETVRAKLHRLAGEAAQKADPQ